MSAPTTPASPTAGSGVYGEALTAAAALVAADAAITPLQRAVALAAAGGENVIGVRERVGAWARNIIRGFWAPVNPYNRGQVDEFAARSTDIMEAAQRAVARSAAAGVNVQLSALGVTVDAAPTPLLDVRASAAVIADGRVDWVRGDSVVTYADGNTVTVTAKDMTTEEVMKRPAAGFRWAAATGDRDAEQHSGLQIDDIVDTQLVLAQRAAETEVIAQAVNLDRRSPRRGAKVVGYRRVIHPEMSRGGTCGLCIAASNTVYKADELRPIHANCKCTIAPVTSEHDPGKALNEQDLNTLYEQAGGTSTAALKRTRYQIDDHGELAAVLVPKKPYRPRNKSKRAAAANNARGAGRAAETKAEIAARHLPILESNLAALRARGVPEDSSQIDYHKQQIAKMQADIAEGSRKPTSGTESDTDSASGPPHAGGGNGGGGNPPTPPPTNTGFSEPGDTPDPSQEVDHSLAGLSNEEIRDRVKSARMPVIDPVNPPHGLRIYGDNALDLDRDIIGHVAYGLTTHGVKSNQQRGHIWGIPAHGRTWFAKSQGLQDMADAIGQVIEDPDYYLPLIEEGNDRRVLLKELSGVMYQAMWYPRPDGKLLFSSIFPLGGSGIYEYSGPPDSLTPRRFPTFDELAEAGFVRVR